MATLRQRVERLEQVAEARASIARKPFGWAVVTPQGEPAPLMLLAYRTEKAAQMALKTKRRGQFLSRGYRVVQLWLDEATKVVTT